MWLLWLLVFPPTWLLAFPPFVVSYCLVAFFKRPGRGAAIAAAVGTVLASGFLLCVYLTGELRNARETGGGDFGVTTRDFLIWAIASASIGWFLGVGTAVGVRRLRRAWEKTTP